MKNTAFALILMLPLASHAWGRRGHEIVGQTAAYLAADEDSLKPLKPHSYDIGYYANVPDFHWKKPATYATEKVEHYMDMEIFERELKKKPEIKDPLKLSRQEFEAAFPEVKSDAGRSFWRIRELDDKIEKTAGELRALKEPTGKARQALQEKWILNAGIMAHYIGDLGMPLHVSENYDGNLTNQKGIHSYFEDICVDQLFPKLAQDVMVSARTQWPAFKKKNADRPVLEMLTELAKGSEKQVPVLLAIDKKSHRADVVKTCAKYDKMIVQQMAASSLVAAELYRRASGWNFDDDHFYFFSGEPAYIQPGQAADATTMKTSDLK
jgi:hypothetical protein